MDGEARRVSGVSELCRQFHLGLVLGPRTCQVDGSVQFHGVTGDGLSVGTSETSTRGRRSLPSRNLDAVGDVSPCLREPRSRGPGSWCACLVLQGWGLSKKTSRRRCLYYHHKWSFLTSPLTASRAPASLFSEIPLPAEAPKHLSFLLSPDPSHHRL